MTTPKTNQLFRLDIQFCDDCRKMGSSGWMKYLSDDSIMGTGLHHPYIKGKAKISPLMDMVFDLKNIDFRWTPEIGFMSDDETLGVTSGKYTRKYIKEGKKVVEIGKYVTTWKKINSEWKIVFDIGN